MIEIVKREENKIEKSEFYPVDKSKPVKLDLGSGINYYKGVNNDEIEEWYHCDGDSADHVEIVCDFAKGIPIETGVADYVHSSDFIEHIPFWLESNIMGEFNRIMKLGCMFFGSTPNFGWSTQEYVAGRMSYEMAQANLYGDRSVSYYHCHFRTFDEQTLIEFLMKWGFGEIDLSQSPGGFPQPWWWVFTCKKIRNI